MHPSPGPESPGPAEPARADKAVAAGDAAAAPPAGDGPEAGPFPGQIHNGAPGPSYAPAAPAVDDPFPAAAGQGSRASGRALGILVGILLVLSIMALL